MMTRAGQTTQHNATHRSGKPDHAGWGQQGQLRAGLQCADSGSIPASQVIVAAEVTQETNDKKQLLPMIAQIAANLEQKPEKVSADTGYFSEANVTDESVKDVDLYVATAGTSTASRWRPAAIRGLSAPCRKMRCGKSYEPRLVAPCTRCARRSLSRFSDRSRNSAVFAASACVAKRMSAASGSWCARSATC